MSKPNRVKADAIAQARGQARKQMQQNATMQLAMLENRKSRIAHIISGVLASGFKVSVTHPQESSVNSVVNFAYEVEKTMSLRMMENLIKEAEENEEESEVQ